MRSRSPLVFGGEGWLKLGLLSSFRGIEVHIKSLKRNCNFMETFKKYCAGNLHYVRPMLDFVSNMKECLGLTNSY